MINGFEVPTQMEGVYQSMGFCPQHDILWEELTVREHLTFYTRLKFAPTDQEEAFVVRLHWLARTWLVVVGRVD